MDSPPDPTKIVDRFAKAFSVIERFAKKGSEEKKKGNDFLGHFYNACFLMLLSVIVIVIVVTIYFVGSRLPENYEWIVIIIAIVPIICLYSLIVKFIKEDKKTD